jgi:hypothetical protein
MRTILQLYFFLSFLAILPGCSSYSLLNPNAENVASARLYIADYGVYDKDPFSIHVKTLWVDGERVVNSDGEVPKIVTLPAGFHTVSGSWEASFARKEKSWLPPGGIHLRGAVRTQITTWEVSEEFNVRHHFVENTANTLEARGYTDWNKREERGHLDARIEVSSHSSFMKDMLETSGKIALVGLSVWLIYEVATYKP